jgi:PAS domain S-box-containing protein
MNEQPAGTKKRIIRLLMKQIILVVIGLSFLLTGVKAFWEYKQEMGHIAKTLEEISADKVEGIKSALWTFDKPLLQNLIQGTLYFPYLNYGAVLDQKRVIVEAGKKKDHGVVVREVPLTREYKGKQVALGSLYLQADSSRILSKVWGDIFEILLIQLILVGLVTFFLFLLFERIVTRHLLKTAGFLGRINFNDSAERLILDKKHQEDEVDILADTINRMHENLVEANRRQRSAQSQLEESEARFRMLIEQAPEAIIVYDVETDRVVEANPNAEKLFGCTREELLKQGIWRFYAPEQPDKRPIAETKAEHIRRTLAGEEIVFERAIRNTRGENLICEMRLVKLPSSVHKLIRNSIIDITERKRMEETLRQSEENYRRIVDTANEGIAVIDASGHYTFINKKHADMLGYEPEEMLGRSPAEFIHRDEQEDHHLKLERRRAGQSDTYERRYLHRDGRIIWFLVNAVPILDDQGEYKGSFGMSTDITERKKTEEQIRSLSQRNETLLGAVPEIIMEVDNNKIYTWANQAGYDFFGPDVLGKEAAYYFEGEQNTYTTVQPLFNGHGETIYVESWQRRKDGEKRLLAWWCRMVKDSEGKVTGALSTARDITDYKKAEEEIHRLNAELEQRVRERTSQLEAANRELEGFSYSVSHDLRAPLRHLTGFVNLLEKQKPKELDEKSRHYLKVISDSAVKMGQLIDDILSFSRMGRAELRRRRINMDDLVREARDLIRQDLQKRDILWKVDVLPEVSADPEMLKMVMTNLIANAVKFTREKERAVIEIGIVEDQPNEVVFYVKDNGSGFDMRYQNKLFGLFQRLHHDYEFPGTGLGLANVRRIIARHGGRTWAEGKVGEGATFYFSLPKEIG